MALAFASLLTATSAADDAASKDLAWPVPAWQRAAPETQGFSAAGELTAWASGISKMPPRPP